MLLLGAGQRCLTADACCCILLLRAAANACRSRCRLLVLLVPAWCCCLLGLLETFGCILVLEIACAACWMLLSSWCCVLLLMCCYCCCLLVLRYPGDLVVLPGAILGASWATRSVDGGKALPMDCDHGKRPDLRRHGNGKSASGTCPRWLMASFALGSLGVKGWLRHRSLLGAVAFKDF